MEKLMDMAGVLSLKSRVSGLGLRSLQRNKHLDIIYELMDTACVIRLGPWVNKIYGPAPPIIITT